MFAASASSDSAQLQSLTLGLLKERTTGCCPRDGLMAPPAGWVLPVETEPLSWHYTLGPEIFRSDASVVRLCRPRASDSSTVFPLVCKTLLRKALKNPEEVESARAEIQALVRLGCGNYECCDSVPVVRLHGVFEDRKGLHLAMDLCEGGDLFGFIVSERGLSEDVAVGISRQVAWALRCCHNMGIIHRDVKPENILLTGEFMLREHPQGAALSSSSVQQGSSSSRSSEESSFTSSRSANASCCSSSPSSYHPTPPFHSYLQEAFPPVSVPVVRLADFGMALVRDDGQVRGRDGPCGSIPYLAPEVHLSDVASPCSEASDVWSLGVTILVMLTGSLPPLNKPVGRVVGMSGREVECVRVRGVYRGDELSGQAVDLLSRMLVWDPQERMTMEQVLEHPWLQ